MNFYCTTQGTNVLMSCRQTIMPLWIFCLEVYSGGCLSWVGCTTPGRSIVVPPPLLLTAAKQLISQIPFFIITLAHFSKHSILHLSLFWAWIQMLIYFWCCSSLQYVSAVAVLKLCLGCLKSYYCIVIGWRYSNWTLISVATNCG